MVQVSTYQYMPLAVRTDLGITDVSTYCLQVVPICGFLYGLVSTSVRTSTGSYQYIPSCTTLYQGYRIPDDDATQLGRSDSEGPDRLEVFVFDHPSSCPSHRVI